MGSTVAKVLTGAWRVSPEAQELLEGELSLATPLLYQSGDAALAWWRIRTSALATSPTGALLHDAYRHLRLAARVHEREINSVVSLLRSEGIEPVLVKGWAIARLYPDSSLRPYGDIDLCVRPDQFAKAEAALKCLENIQGHYVDLHNGFTKLEGRQPRDLECGDFSPLSLRHSEARLATKHYQAKPYQSGAESPHSKLWDELIERSQLVPLGEEKIRVLSEEDHLRVLCLHLLRSGAWRPLWLCDVALVLETRAPDFDWDICLSNDRYQADWIACSIGLAHHMLGVDIEDTPVTERANRLPHWLVPAVLRQWNRCRNSHAAGMALPTLLAGITEPKKIFSELYARWDNPVRATVALRGRFNNWPRLPYQLAELITRSPEVPKQLALLFRQLATPKAFERSIPGNVWSVMSDL